MYIIRQEIEYYSLSAELLNLNNDDRERSTFYCEEDIKNFFVKRA